MIIQIKGLMTLAFWSKQNGAEWRTQVTFLSYYLDSEYLDIETTVGLVIKHLKKSSFSFSEFFKYINLVKATGNK